MCKTSTQNRHQNLPRYLEALPCDLSDISNKDYDTQIELRMRVIAKIIAESPLSHDAFRKKITRSPVGVSRGRRWIRKLWNKYTRPDSCAGLFAVVIEHALLGLGLIAFLMYAAAAFSDASEKSNSIS